MDSAMIFFILAQIVGVFIVIFNGISAFQKKKDKLMLYNAVSNFLCCVQYLLLGAYTGIICCLIAVIRNIVFSKYKIVPMYIFVIYVVISLVANIPFIHGIIDILPIIAIVVYAYALRQSKVKEIKKSLIVSGICGLIYDINQRAYSGLLLNLTDLVGGINGVIKKKRRRK